jgi:hypothetical protein
MNKDSQKQLIADQLNIDMNRILLVQRTWKNWVVSLETCGTGEDLVLVIPHHKLPKIDRLSTAISEFSI